MLITPHYTKNLSGRPTNNVNCPIAPSCTSNGMVTCSELNQSCHEPTVMKSTTAKEIANFSVNWLTYHILGLDKQFGDWFIQHKK